MVPDMTNNNLRAHGQFDAAKFARVRKMIERTDMHASRLIPWAICDLVAGSLSEQHSNQYVVESLPPLYLAMSKLLRAAGTYRQAPAPQNFAAAKHELLVALETVCDEVRLSYEPQLSQLAG
jgi:hypothetical protein